MLDQAFSPQSLARLIRREDVARYRLWRAAEDRNEVLRRISVAISGHGFEFPTFREKMIRGHAVFSAPDATTMLALRKLDRNMRAIYKVKQANRDSLVHQVKSLLQEGCSFAVLRLDIHSFYESVDRGKLLERIARDSILSYNSRVLLKKLFQAPQFASQRGIPRGLCVSATLAELYTRDLDQRMRSLQHVYFYGRYVDDIIVFSHASREDAERDVAQAIQESGLALNTRKTAIVVCHGQGKHNDRTCDRFDFLGYSFCCERYLDKIGEWRRVRVCIAQSKIKIMKSRIAHAFADYGARQDFPLLHKRIRFLAGNYVLRGSKRAGLCGGVYYNYRHINDMENLDDLDRFLRRLTFSRKGSLGQKLRDKLSDEQRQHLLKVSFRSAYEKRFSMRLPWGIRKQLRQCWAYEKN